MGDLNEAVRLDPSAPWSLLYRAKVFQATQQYDRALADVEATLKIQPDLEAAITLRAELNKLLGVHEETDKVKSKPEKGESKE